MLWGGDPSEETPAAEVLVVPSAELPPEFPAVGAAEVPAVAAAVLGGVLERLLLCDRKIFSKAAVKATVKAAVEGTC